jgi:N-acetylmuramoyl-L-alanine amidase
MTKLICIDPGHGGVDNGASYGFVEEDDTNLAIAFYLDYELRLSGFNTILTREKDEYFSLYQRVLTANIKKADLFISIHCDAFHAVTAKGMTVHVSTKSSTRSMTLANSIDGQLKIQFPEHQHREIKRSNFYVLSGTEMPAVLIECEFLSNPETRDFLKEPENQRRLARSISGGIISVA